MARDAWSESKNLIAPGNGLQSSAPLGLAISGFFLFHRTNGKVCESGNPF